jgi:hypothetical protein
LNCDTEREKLIKEQMDISKMEETEELTKEQKDENSQRMLKIFERMA